MDNELNFVIITGRKQTLLTSGIVGRPPVRYSAHPAFPELEFPYIGPDPAAVKITSEEHLYVILERQTQPTVVALVDSPQAWKEFCRVYPLGQHEAVRYSLLMHDEHQRIILGLHPKQPGRRRLEHSHWSSKPE